MHLLLVLLSVYVIFSKNSFTPAPFLERSECKGTYFQHSHQTFRGYFFDEMQLFRLCLQTGSITPYYII